MAAGAAFFQEEPVAELNFVLGWLAELRNTGEQVGIGELGGDVLRDLIEIFVRPTVARHSQCAAGSLADRGAS